MDKKTAAVSVILPTLNEEKNISALVKALLSSGKFAEVLVVDDGSTDGTQDAVEGLNDGRARFIDRSKESVHGLTASVLEGIRRAKGEFIIVMDGDGQHPPEKAKEIAEKLASGFDLVVACRSSVPGWSIERQITSKGAETLARLRLFISGRHAPSDPLSGFFGIRKELALQIMEKAKFEPKGYKVLFDLLKAMPNGLKIGEVPYIFGSRKGGTSKIGMRHIALFFRSIFT